MALIGGFTKKLSSTDIEDYNKNKSNSQDGKDSKYSELSEIKEKLIPKRKSSILLSESYKRIGLGNKFERVSDCGTFLEYAHEISSDGVISTKGKLHTANFCKDRLCPMCSWRRSYKIFGQVSQIMELIGSNYRFIFLTLTVKNCRAEDLSKTITMIMKSWEKLIGRKRYKESVKGFFRALEVTRNESTGEYHPHLHIVLAVLPSYFNSRDYIKHDEWLELWQSCTKDKDITQVDIRIAKDKNKESAEKAVKDLSSAVAEIAKYSVKSSDYIVPDNEILTDSIVETLSEALNQRRISAFGGCFKEAFKQLQLDDSEDGDLVHINEKLDSTLAWLIVRYGWKCGAYSLTDSFIKVPEQESKQE